MKTLTCLISLLLSVQFLRADVIAVPGQFAMANGDAATGRPFGINSFVVQSIRYQQVYGASAFSEISSGGGWITGLAFRLETVGLGGQIPDAQLSLSTTLKAPDGLSTVFAENIGADDTVVHDRGGLPLGNNTPGAPSYFPVFVPLHRPFFYDPAAGSLLLDVRVYQTPHPLNTPGQFDASNVVGDSISTVVALDVASLTGNAATLGLITAFVVTPVPEPGVIALALLAVPFIFFAVRRTKT